MRTRDRILETSLDLFNDEGETEQTAVDIANALDISPGNLYYHFKGKDAIIRALFDNFETEMKTILRGSRGRIASLEDNWVYTYIILEEIYDFRFFFRALSVLLDRYPDLATRFRALLAEMRNTIEDILDGLQTADLIEIDPRLRDPLIDQLISTMVFWLSRSALTQSDADERTLIHRTVFEAMALVVPYMDDAGIDALSSLVDHYEKVIK
ncbi:MAG: TetR/AcrR family transcriptional regulator [Pseudomonadota bacterium]